VIKNTNIPEKIMNIRKSAVDLETSEREKFREALIKLKHKPAPVTSVDVSVYDQYVALHGAVMEVRAPGSPDLINFGHWNIGFGPWHRQYLRQFEKALQAEVPGVTIPYWDWTDHVDAINELFTPTFLSSLIAGSPPRPITDGLLRNLVPEGERSEWWPAGAQGFPVNPLLEEGRGTALTGGNPGIGWPPSRFQIERLERFAVDRPDSHPFWFFWLVLEAGNQGVALRTHNAGHNIIGGHMGGGFSPNDPIFWLHHANVDRIWANWQRNRLQDVPSSTHADHWPLPNELSPINGELAPLGHRLNDPMWPWVGKGNVQGYDTESMSAEVKSMLPDFSQVEPVTVKDVLDTEAMGYRYEPPTNGSN
jgi:tyrosinase